MLGHKRALRTAGVAMATALVAGLLSMSVPFVANAAPPQTAGAKSVQAAAAEDPTGCNYGTGSPGKYAESICWIDFSQYDEATARSAAGQSFTVTIGGGYSATFQLKTRAIAGWPFHSTEATTAAVQGAGSAWAGTYYPTTAGKPILWNIGGWAQPGVPNQSGVTWTLDDIEVSGPDGIAVNDFKFVSGDSEATWTGESVGFGSDVALELLEELRGGDGGCLIENVTGVGTNNVMCTGVTPSPGNGVSSNILFASQSPAYISQTIMSKSRNSGVFGFMMSKVQLAKVVDGRTNSADSFGLSIQNGESVVGTATTGTDAGATTGVQTVLAGSTITMSEVAEGSTKLSDYDASWSCLRNGVVDPGLIANADGSELEIAGQTGATGDFINCTITNTAKPREIEIAKTSDATTDSRPGDTVSYTVTATNTGEVDFNDENPAVIIDDLSEVLDDADYNGDAVADQAGPVSYESPLLSWSGGLPAGESVSLTYTVTLKAGGDGELRNVACVYDSIVMDGPVAGEPCAEVVTVLPKLEISKAADKTEVQTVGEKVTYTITVTNVGLGAYTETAPATMTDDLSDVLDDATFDDDSLSASVGAVVRDGTQLSWSGPLASGESATISYTVTFTKTGKGDFNFLNLACVPESEVVAGGTPCSTVEIPLPNIIIDKSVDPLSGTTVSAGQELSYTLTFENDGKAPGDVDRVDDLTRVLDDAELITEPAASDEALSVTRDGARISITGSLAVGQKVTVTYTVKVKEEADRGDNILANFVIKPTEEPPTVCDPEGNPEVPCTENFVGEITPSKSVDPKSGTTVNDGQTLTYTLSFTNTGEGAAVVDYTDYLVGVLDDASWVGNLVVSDGLTVARPTENTLLVTGTVQSGETSTVTYQVKVKPYANQGNHKLGNFLTETGEEPPVTCVAESPLCTENPTEPPVPGLASTGMEAAGLLLGALLLVGLGGGALVISRRRKRATLVTDGAEEVFGSAI